MLESETKRSADKLLGEVVRGNIRLLSARKVDYEMDKRDVDVLRQSGLLNMSDPEYDALIHDLRDRISSPRWIVSYMIIQGNWEDMTIAYVTIDEENGKAEVYIHPRGSQGQGEEGKGQAAQPG
jgi:hypothetical protein